MLSVRSDNHLRYGAAVSETDTFAADLAALAASTARLLATLDGISDADARGPSRLPAWTRGHVLTHLARNADALGNLTRWAVTGVEHPMYASAAARDADIAAGADRAALGLVEDVRTSAQRLQGALGGMTGEALERRVTFRSGVHCPGAELPYRRMREVEIHHVDLALGYTPAHWPPGFAVRTLDEITQGFLAKASPVATLHDRGAGRTWTIAGAGPRLVGQDSALLAWLTGRSDGAGLVLEGADTGAPVPPAPEWS